MRISIVLCVMACLLAGCGERRAATAEPVTPTADTPTVAADTLADTVSTPVPKAADEVFDDFLYAFTTNPRFQRSRILFPLQRQVGGRAVRPVERAQWKFNALHLRGDYYTVLYGNEKQLKIEKSGDLHHANVELINLRRGEVAQYVFGRHDGRWMLQQTSTKPLAEHPNAEFFKFYNHFATDSAYQYHHLAHTLGFTTYDADNHYQRIDGYVNRDQWSAFRPELPAGTITNIDYGQTFNNPNQRVFVMNGNSSGMQSILTFHKDNGRWRLVSFEN